MEPLDRAVEQIRKEVPAVQAIYLFGSMAQNETHAESDVDLAVLAAAPLDAIRRWGLQEALAGMLHRDVDLVDLRSASTVMRVQVLTSDRLLFDGAPAERASFEATSLGAYARFNEERRGILEDIRERGSVHG